MKTFTDLEQSKKLVKILPIESADMFYYKDAVTKEDNPQVMDYSQVPKIKSMYYFPAWSLTALLDVMPISCDDGRHCLSLINSNPNGEVDWLCCYEDDNGNLMMECYGNNQIDACYEMIIKLKENNLL